MRNDIRALYKSALCRTCLSEFNISLTYSLTLNFVHKIHTYLTFTNLYACIGYALNAYVLPYSSLIIIKILIIRVCIVFRMWIWINVVLDQNGWLGIITIRVRKVFFVGGIWHAACEKWLSTHVRLHWRWNVKIRFGLVTYLLPRFFMNQIGRCLLLCCLW